MFLPYGGHTSTCQASRATQAARWLVQLARLELDLRLV